jgi:hypothetical protein
MDRTTKILLALIAVGLWANAAIATFGPIKAVAQNPKLEDKISHIESMISLIQDGVVDIAEGDCANSKICGTQ